MGCWNATCGLSNLPIESGEECYGVIVFEATDKISLSGMSYPNQIAIPGSFPFVGEYNDYGSLEEVRDDFSKLMTKNILLTLESMGRLRINKENRQAEYYIKNLLNNNEANFREIDFEAMLELIERDLLEYSGHMEDGWHKLGLKLFKKSFADQVLEIKDVEPEYANLVQNTIERILSEQYASTVPTRQLSQTPELAYRLGWIAATTGWFYTTMLSEIIFTEDKDKNLEVLEGLNKFEKFLFGIDQLRKTWAPDSGKGSQTFITGIHKRFSQAYAKEIQKAEESYGIE